MTKADLTEVQYFANSLGVGITIDGRNGISLGGLLRCFKTPSR